MSAWRMLFLHYLPQYMTGAMLDDEQNERIHHQEEKKLFSHFQWIKIQTNQKLTLIDTTSIESNLQRVSSFFFFLISFLGFDTKENTNDEHFSIFFFLFFHLNIFVCEQYQSYSWLFCLSTLDEFVTMQSHITYSLRFLCFVREELQSNG